MPVKLIQDYCIRVRLLRLRGVNSFDSCVKSAVQGAYEYDVQKKMLNILSCSITTITATKPLPIKSALDRDVVTVMMVYMKCFYCNRILAISNKVHLIFMLSFSVMRVDLLKCLHVECQKRRRRAAVFILW